MYSKLIVFTALHKIGKENGAAVSSRISNFRRATRASLNQPDQISMSDAKRNNVRMNQGEEARKLLIADATRWRKTVSSYEMSLLKNNCFKNKEIR